MNELVQYVEYRYIYNNMKEIKFKCGEHEPDETHFLLIPVIFVENKNYIKKITYFYSRGGYYQGTSS